MSKRKEGTYSWLQMDISETKPDIPLATFFSFLSQLAWSTSPRTIMKISLRHQIQKPQNLS